ncbi:TonB-dependent receptor [bacterium]|nr:TonB-dependent receptor [bacterium]
MDFSIKKHLIAGIGCFFLLFAGAALPQDNQDLLSLSLEDLLNLEIFSASKRSENVFDSPLSSTVISKEEIESAGVTGIEEIFRLVPGFIVREETNGNFDVHIRGNDNIPPGNFIFFSENMMSLVMIDGRTVFNNMNGGILWETLPISVHDIDRVEIIRGPASALYGPNAVTGVINFITRKPEDRPAALDGSFTQGTPKTRLADAAVTASLADNRFKVRVSGLYEERNRFEEDYYSFVTGRYGPPTGLFDYINGSQASDGERFWKHDRAKERMAGSVSLFGDLNDNAHLFLAGGAEESKSQAVLMEMTSTPLSVRESSTRFFNGTADFYGLTAQFSGNSGTRNIQVGNDAGKFDLTTLDGSLEYEFTLGPAIIRPGISYQRVVYADMPYAGGDGRGLLNGEKKLTNSAAFIRSEFNPVDRLRLIAALRMDRYNHPDNDYFTYQFAGTYRFTEKTLGRLVYSRANRGPFMLDVHVDYNEHPEGALIQYRGIPDLTLPTMDMLELGFRKKISDNIQLDIEAFYTKTDHFTTFEPDVMNLTAEGLLIMYHYKNIEAVARQFGCTANLEFAFSSTLRGRMFGTLQKTTLDNFDQRISPLVINPVESIFLLPEYETVSITHKQTPAFYGGLNISYHPFSRMNINASLYYLGGHVYRHDFASYDENTGQTEVSGKFIPLIHVDYRLVSNFSVFLTAKNFFQDSAEFGFSDRIGALVMTGCSITM